MQEQFNELGKIATHIMERLQRTHRSDELANLVSDACRHETKSEEENCIAIANLLHETDEQSAEYEDVKIAHRYQLVETMAACLIRTGNEYAFINLLANYDFTIGFDKKLQQNSKLAFLAQKAKEENQAWAEFKPQKAA